eukprot:GHVU01018346.1.p1 GENE.GHVU01018346.1~~GHVU01018346.1.p1  ORF type:complete len:110 (+),score=5.96 GHVU01018346.1:312-641(+)
MIIGQYLTTIKLVLLQVFNLQMCNYIFHFQHNVTNKFETKKGDLIGWTCAGASLPISKDLVTGHQTYVREIENNTLPVTEFEYTFSETYVAAAYSVAVNVEPLERTYKY